MSCECASPCTCDCLSCAVHGLHLAPQWKPAKVVAILEVMWDWRSMTSSAGYRETAPPFFRINADNFSGRRLYALIGPEADLVVTNACAELVTSAKERGTPNPKWLHDNLAMLDGGDGIDLILACGKVAQKTLKLTGWKPRRATVLGISHPAARFIWNQELIAATTAQIREALTRSEAKP